MKSLSEEAEIFEIADVFQRLLFGIPFHGIPDDSWDPMTNLTIRWGPDWDAVNLFQANILATALEKLARRVRNMEHL